MMKYTFPLFFSLFMMLSVCLPLSASAEGSAPLSSEQQEDYDAMLQEAVEHYGARRYEDAIALFKDALDIQEEPELLYNIARSYERLADSEEAVSWYEKFLKMPGTTGDLRTRALTNIAALRREIAAKEEVRRAEQSQRASAGQGDGSTEDGLTGDREGGPDADGGNYTSDENEYKSDEHSSSDTSGKRLKVIGLSLLGGGVAVMATGSIFGGLALATKGDYDSAGFDPERIDFREDMTRNALIFDIVFTTGAVLTAAGGALLILRAVKNRSEKETVADARTRKDQDNKTRAITFTPTFFVDQSTLAGGLVGRF
jgi:tetratricopeptide (TPR) repeat protein